MNKHIQMVHDNITPYHCQAFKSKAGLESHMGRVHEGKKYEFKCEMCPKILATAVSLKGHIEAVHEKKSCFWWKRPFPLTNENSCITTTQEKFMILYWK